LEEASQVLAMWNVEVLFCRLRLSLCEGKGREREAGNEEGSEGRHGEVAEIDMGGWTKVKNAQVAQATDRVSDRALEVVLTRWNESLQHSLTKSENCAGLHRAASSTIRWMGSGRKRLGGQAV